MGRYTHRNASGDAGEYLVAYIFASQLGWAYRILDSDTGIDGEVEIFDDEVPSGRLLKIQVKSTAGVFKTMAGDCGDVDDTPKSFSVSLKKTDVFYWRMLALPVVLCVAHIPDSKVHFLIIDESIVIPDGDEATFSVTVPKGNVLAAGSRTPFADAAPLRDYNPLRRLLEQASRKCDSMSAEGGYSYAFDKKERLRSLFAQCEQLRSAIRR